MLNPTAEALALHKSKCNLAAMLPNFNKEKDLKNFDVPRSLWIDFLCTAVLFLDIFLGAVALGVADAVVPHPPWGLRSGVAEQHGGAHGAVFRPSHSS